ncbi:MAG TPA: hypothetical protein VGO47_14210 [Chlamydiales bacterium]|nr:hypothetical protein [Chlamydiales bacterium]
MPTSNTTWTNQVDIGIARGLRWGNRRVLPSTLLNVKNEGNPKTALKVMCENVKADPFQIAPSSHKISEKLKGQLTNV